MCVGNDEAAVRATVSLLANLVPSNAADVKGAACHPAVIPWVDSSLSLKENLKTSFLGSDTGSVTDHPNLAVRCNIHVLTGVSHSIIATVPVDCQACGHFGCECTSTTSSACVCCV